MIINKVNIDKWLFDYFEGNLSTHEKMEIERFIEANPEYEIDLEAWEDSYEFAQEVPVYNVSNNLYKKHFLVKHKYLMTGFLIFFLFTGSLFYYNSQKNTTIELLTQLASTSIDKVDGSNQIKQEIKHSVDKDSYVLDSDENLFLKKDKKTEVVAKNNLTPIKRTNFIAQKKKVELKDNKNKRQLNLKTKQNKRSKKVIVKSNKIIRHKEEKHKRTKSIKEQTTYKGKRRKIKPIKNKLPEKEIVKYYKPFKKENLNTKYQYLNYQRKVNTPSYSDKKDKRRSVKKVKDAEPLDRKRTYFDNIALIGVLFNKNGKVDKKKKISLLDKLKHKELALTNTHDPIFLTNKGNPLENNIALTGGLNMTRIKMGIQDGWIGTLNNRRGGVLSADTYFKKINAGVGIITQNRNYANIGVMSNEIGLIYTQRIQLNENKSLSLGGKYTYVKSDLSQNKLENLDSDKALELKNNNSLLQSNSLKKLTLINQNNLAFSTWYDGRFLYGGVNIENIKTQKSENNNANQFAEYINPVKFAVQLGTDYRKNAYSALIISPQLNYFYANKNSEFWVGSTLKYKSFVTGIGASTLKNVKLDVGVQGDKMRLIYGFNYSKSITDSKFYGTHEITFRYILRSKNNWKNK